MQHSVASTRANSPGSSTATEDVECDSPSPRKQVCGGFAAGDVQKISIPGLHCETRDAILRDLGVGLNCNSCSGTAPNTAEGIPCPSAVGSQGRAAHMPCTPTSMMCASPVSLTGTRPPVGDASQRSPKVPDASQRSPTGMASPGLLNGLRSCEASQRTPPQGVAQRINGGLLRTYNASQRSPKFPDAFQSSSTGISSPGLLSTRSCDASERTPPQRMGQHINLGLNTIGGGDACQSSPVRHGMHQLTGVSSWGAAAASIAATRSAAVSFASPMEACPTDSVKSWLAGVSKNSMPSGEDLAEQLLAAQPDTYED